MFTLFRPGVSHLDLSHLDLSHLGLSHLGLSHLGCVGALRMQCMIPPRIRHALPAIDCAK